MQVTTGKGQGRVYVPIRDVYAALAAMAKSSAVELRGLNGHAQQLHIMVPARTHKRRGTAATK